MTLQVDNGADATGTSNTFAVKNQLQVVSTTPAPSGIFALPGPLTYTVTFSEPVAPDSVTTGSLMVSGISGATVTGVTLSTDDMTATFTIDGITTEGTLTASIPTGAIPDQYGFPIAAFSARYLVDITTIAFPGPLTAVNPSGSLVYQGSADGNVQWSTDTDSFTINLDAGQTLTADVTPNMSSDGVTRIGLEPTVTITGPDGTCSVLRRPRNRRRGIS